MTSENFVDWLDGFYSLKNPKTISKEQTKIIKEHLKLVFKYDIDPSYTDSKEEQAEMQKIHDGELDLDGTFVKGKKRSSSQVNIHRSGPIAKC